MKKQLGYTIAEILTGIAALASLGMIVAVLVAVVHFVRKFW